jgi:hypothetical protein
VRSSALRTPGTMNCSPVKNAVITNTTIVIIGLRGGVLLMLELRPHDVRVRLTFRSSQKMHTMGASFTAIQEAACR